MKRQNVIITTAPAIECWGNFKKLCEAKGLPYHSLKMKQFPIQHENYIIHKVTFR